MEGGRTGRGRGGALARSRRLEDRFVLRENSLNTVIEQGQPNTTDRFAHGSGSQTCATASGLCATAFPPAKLENGEVEACFLETQHVYTLIRSCFESVPSQTSRTIGTLHKTRGLACNGH